VKSGRIMISAQEIDKDLYAVIDLLTAKVRTQIKKHMEKLEARKVRAPSAVEVLSEPEGSAAAQATGAQQRQ
jgi:ribosome-associated translation inhibitor RaiA